MHHLTCSLPSSPSISHFISAHPSLLLLETHCTTMRDLHQLHSHLIRTGLAADPIAASRLLSFCAASPSGDLRYASLLLSRSPHPTPFMYNTLMRAFSHSSTPHLSFHLFHRMLLSTAQPQPFTFPSLFTAAAHLGWPHLGSQLHAMVLKLGFAADPYTRNSILSLYSSCGHVAEALRVFEECCACNSSFVDFDFVPWNSMILGLAKKGLVDESRALFDQMPAKNVVTWSAMIGGYVRNGMNSEALELFHWMQMKGVEPNDQILVSLLGACSSLGALEQGAWIHAYIEKHRIEEANVIVTTALIDMYCKCGCLAKAYKVFDGSPAKGLSSWNSMISGLAIHGHGEEAIRVYSRLRTSGLRPDGVSFLGILTACSHSGLVDKARYYFALMTEEYGIKPGVEHYGCLVDGLGRAGLLKEAEGLIMGMPMEPDVAVWGSLLSACRIHGDVEMGERAAARIVELDPGDSGGYVILSNTYAGRGDFCGALKAKAKMKEKGVEKEPGCSLVEVNGEAHEFVAGGVLHSQASETYGVLDGLALRLGEEESN